MIVVYVLLSLLALVLIIALFVSRDMNYDKSVTIQAKINDVWKNVSSLGTMDKWSPWNEKDPNMERKISGTDGAIGAKQSWKSDVKGVGEGSQTIVAINEPNHFGTRLDFIKPFKSTAEGYVNLQEQEGGTIVTWGFKSKMPYPMNLMKLFMNFEKSIEGDFTSGLNKLKNICEEKAALKVSEESA